MNLKQLIEMRGMTQTQLAKKLVTTPQAVTRWLNGKRAIGEKYLQPMAQALNVSAAYIAGYPAKLPVYDWQTKQTVVMSIVADVEIPDYGVLYLVERPDAGLLAVIVSEGLQMTTTKKDQQPLTVDEIENYHWVNNYGEPTIMLNGLPRTLFDVKAGE